MQTHHQQRDNEIERLLSAGMAITLLHGIKPDGTCTCGKTDCGSPGKHPIRKWTERKNQAHTHEEALELFKNAPYANIGVLTGAASQGLVVLDYDGEDAYERLDQHMQKYAIPPRAVVKTGRGLHLYLRLPPGVELGNSAKTFDGIDIRGEGGYVVAPPSVHKSGYLYEWVEGSSLANIPEMPAALVADIQERLPSNTAQATPYGLKALQEELHELQNASEGTRNDALNKAAFSMGQLCASGDLNAEKVVQNLQNVALSIGLTSQETAKTIESGLKKGFLTPRQNKYLVPQQDNRQWCQSDIPRPLPPLHTPVPVMTEDLLPARFRDFAIAAAKQTNVNLEFIGVPLLVTTAAVIGLQVVISPKRSREWLEAGVLWGLLVARAGWKKSPALKTAMKNIYRLEKKFRTEFDEENGGLAEEIELLRTEKKVLQDKLDPRKNGGKPILAEEKKSLTSQITALGVQIRKLEKKSARRLVVNDATIAKLGMLLNSNPNGLLVFRDEVYAMLHSFRKAGSEGDREFFLEAFNGLGSFTTDRVERGTTVIENLYLCLLGGIQPSKLEAYIHSNFSTGVGDDGLIQRFQLTVWPDRMPPYEDNSHITLKLYDEKMYKLFNTLTQLKISVPQDGSYEPEERPTLEFDDEAQEFFTACDKEYHIRLLSDKMSQCPSFASHLAKFPGLLARLSMVLHVVDNVDSSGTVPPRVSLDTVQRAKRLCDFLEAHAHKLYAEEFAPEKRPARALARNILSGRVEDGLSFRTLSRNGWRDLNTPDALRDAVKALEELKWVKTETQQRTGDPSVIIRINPLILENPEKFWPLLEGTDVTDG